MSNVWQTFSGVPAIDTPKAVFYVGATGIPEIDPGDFEYDSGLNKLTLHGPNPIVQAVASVLNNTAKFYFTDGTNAGQIMVSGGTGYLDFPTSLTLRDSNAANATRGIFSAAGFSIPGNATLGDSITDAHTINGPTAFNVAAGAGLQIVAAAAGDRAFLIANIAGSGGSLYAYNSGVTDFTPWTIGGDYVVVSARTGVATLAEITRTLSTGFQIKTAKTLQFYNSANNAVSEIFNAAGSGVRTLDFLCGTRQAQIIEAAGATRYLTFTGSNGGDPAIGVNAGNVQIANDLVMASTKQIILSGGGQILATATGVGLTFNGDTGLNTGLGWLAEDVFGGFTGGTERSRTTAGGYTKLSNSATYDSSTGAFHEVYTSDNGGNYAVVITAAGATAGNQYGPKIRLAGDPNGVTPYFLFCAGNATERATIRSNGGLANFSANNVNLSDIRAKNFESLRSANLLSGLWTAHKNIDWGRYKYHDQTHHDWNFGPNAQQLMIAFQDIDHSMIEYWNNESGLLSVYQEDLHNITGAIVTEAQRKIDELTSRVQYLESKLVH